MTSPASGVSTERIPFARTTICDEAREAASRVLTSGWVTTGPETAEFEKAFAAWIGAAHAVAVSSCTTAIELSLRSLQLPAGSPVLTSTITFCGAVNAILHAGLRPVLVDVDPETLMPDEQTTAAAVHTAGRPSAMVALHFAGHPAPVEMMADVAGLPLSRVVEDAAHAVGATAGDRAVGTISAATCFSFYATKNLPIGEGGMVTANDPAVADYVRRGRLHGMSRDAWKRYLPGSGWRYSVDVAGLKANMTDLQAAIGRAQMRHFDEWQARRKEIVARYDRALAQVPGIQVPARPADGGHAWHLYVIRVLPSFGISRDEFIAHLHEQGIDCSVHFIPVHQQPYLRSFIGDGVDPARFPFAESVFQQIVSLPLYPALRDDHVDRVCQVIAALGQRNGGPRASRHNSGRDLDAPGQQGTWQTSIDPDTARGDRKPPFNGSRGDLA
jgi:dTDP-4-amino-4,6-dideoxygalactose transaminase